MWATVAALMLLSGSVWAAGYGIQLRHEMWDATKPVRFVPDMENAWNWGSRASSEGYVDLYDRVVAEHPDGNYGLDYVPLRLAVMTVWAGERRAGGATEWRGSWAFNAPLMRFNMVCDAVACAAMAWMVFIVLRRAGKGALWAGGMGLGTAALLWLNPAVHVSGYGRPTWDIWILPFFLVSALCTVSRQWFLAGATLAVGTMFKGQMSGMVAFFLIWGLVAGGPRGVVSLLGGLVFGAAVLLSPWLLSYRPAAGYGGGQAVLDGVWGRKLARAGRAGVGGGVVAVMAGFVAGHVLTRSFRQRRLDRRRRGMSVRARFPWRWAVPVALLVAGAVAFSRVPFGHGSMAWYEVSFRYGADKFPALDTGGSASLANLLQSRYGWTPNSLVFGLIKMKPLLTLVFAACLVPLAVFAGVHQRRRTPRVLLTLPAVWICFFTFMPLMHERYLLWGAACASAALPISPGLTLLGLALSAASYVMTLRVMLGFGDRGKFHLFGYAGYRWLGWIDQLIPDLAWMVIPAALLFLWACIPPWRHPRREAAVGA